MRALALAAPLVAFGLVGCGQSSSDVPGGADAAPDAPLPPPDHDAATPTDAGADVAPADGGLDAWVAGWKLSWSDEFDGPNGAAPDPTKWTHDVGGSGWGNQEREYYTDSVANAFLDAGSLVIEASKDGTSGLSCWYGPCLYTSARVLTKGHFSQAYGRFEARAKLPFGQGLWPAFWMLGDDIDSKGWPTCGEIDVMENIGREPSTNHGTLHGPDGKGGATGIGAAYTLDGGAKLSDDFHVYALEWEPNVARFYVDGNLYETRTPADDPPGATWVYDHPFFVLLNVAVGGSWPGDPDGTTTFPQELRVDYVRVYTR